MAIDRPLDSEAFKIRLDKLSAEANFIRGATPGWQEFEARQLGRDLSRYLVDVAAALLLPLRGEESLHIVALYELQDEFGPGIVTRWSVD
ncbi:MAG: hypothetical protein U9Q03_04280 [Patescibacteria group bacterium]|nr:hypothetical protein [Patescibacteria group bacterium]